MTCDLKQILESMIPAFGSMKMTAAQELISSVNDKLSGTPYMYLICGSGVIVVMRAQMVEIAQNHFDAPMDNGP